MAGETSTPAVDTRLKPYDVYKGRFVWNEQIKQREFIKEGKPTRVGQMLHPEQVEEFNNARKGIDLNTITEQIFPSSTKK